MAHLDLSPYLIDIYTHSRGIAEWHNSKNELSEHLNSIERWWERRKELGTPLPSGMAYMMLTHINMFKGYIYSRFAGDDWKKSYKNLYRIEAEILEHFSHDNEVLERQALEDTSSNS